ncbi:MAG: ABC transporter substrate-binding protein [Rhodobacteraceae bacterium]|nr:ABC transporter substrate-binding protein [Paracoccaceae bacterium]
MASVRLWIGAMSVAAVTFGGTSIAGARDFTVASWGGAYSEAQRQIFLEPFAAARGIGVLTDTYLGGWGQFEAMKQTGTVNWDVVDIEASALVRGCEEGVFERLDWSRFTNAGDLASWGKAECGLGVVAGSLLVVYNRNTIGAEVPKNVADFFDLARWPGKRAMRNRPENMLELALLADGVAPADMYKVLGTPEGVDRAFAKLDTIKSQLVWWEAGAQASELLLSGEAQMGISYNGRTATAQREGLPLEMVWENAVVYADYWIIMSGTPHLDVAYEFLNSTLDVDKQVAFANRFPYEPSLATATAKLAPEIAAGLPVGDKLVNSIFVSTDEGVRFWQDNADALTERWTAWRAN